MFKLPRMRYTRAAILATGIALLASASAHASDGPKYHFCSETRTQWTIEASKGGYGEGGRYPSASCSWAKRVYAKARAYQRASDGIGVGDQFKLRVDGNRVYCFTTTNREDYVVYCDSGYGHNYRAANFNHSL